MFGPLLPSCIGLDWYGGKRASCCAWWFKGIDFRYACAAAADDESITVGDGSPNSAGSNGIGGGLGVVEWPPDSLRRNKLKMDKRFVCGSGAEGDGSDEAWEF
jgi:hypothetical protein